MRAAFDKLGGRPRGLEVVCANRIPHSRGLGSSAAAIVAGIVAARGLVVGGQRADERRRLLHLATGLEGHPGQRRRLLARRAHAVVDGRQRGRSGRAVDLELSPDIAPVAFVPGSTSSTQGHPKTDPGHRAARRRRGTPPGRPARHGVARRPDLLLTPTDDPLHQPYRAPAMPRTRPWSSVREQGIPAVVSGAGPTVLALASSVPGRADAAHAWRWFAATPSRSTPREPRPAAVRRAGPDTPPADAPASGEWLDEQTAMWCYAGGASSSRQAAAAAPQRRAGDRLRPPESDLFVTRCPAGPKVPERRGSPVNLARGVVMARPCTSPIARGRRALPREGTCDRQHRRPGPRDRVSEYGGNGTAARKRRGNGLSGKLLPELQKIAGSLGISGTAKMRKGELIAAIQSCQAPVASSSGSNGATTSSTPSSTASTASGATNGADSGSDSGSDSGGDRSANGSANGSAQRPARGRQGAAARPTAPQDRPASEGSTSDGATAPTSESAAQTAESGAGGALTNGGRAKSASTPETAIATATVTASTASRRGRASNSRASNSRASSRASNSRASRRASATAGQPRRDRSDDDDFDGSRRQPRPVPGAWRPRPAAAWPRPVRRSGAGGQRGRRAGADRRHRRHPRQLRVRAHLGLPPGPNDVYVSLAQVRRYGCARATR